MTLWRAQVRDTAKTLLAAAFKAAGAAVSLEEGDPETQNGVENGALDGVTLDLGSSVDTPIQGIGRASVIVYVSDNKGSGSLSAPQFRTDLRMDIEVRCGADTKPKAEALLDQLCDIIENNLLGAPQFMRNFEQVDGFDTQPDYNGTAGAAHIFMADITITGHTSERFEPTVETDLTKVAVYRGGGIEPDKPPFAQISIPTE